MRKVSFSFSAILKFGRPNLVSPKLVYRPQIGSRSAPGNGVRQGFGAVMILNRDVCDVRKT